MLNFNLKVAFYFLRWSSLTLIGLGTSALLAHPAVVGPMEWHWPQGEEQIEQLNSCEDSMPVAWCQCLDVLFQDLFFSQTQNTDQNRLHQCQDLLSTTASQFEQNPNAQPMVVVKPYRAGNIDYYGLLLLEPRSFGIGAQVEVTPADRSRGVANQWQTHWGLAGTFQRQVSYGPSNRLTLIPQIHFQYRQWRAGLGLGGSLVLGPNQGDSALQLVPTTYLGLKLGSRITTQLYGQFPLTPQYGWTLGLPRIGVMALVKIR